MAQCKERNQKFFVDVMNLHPEVTGSCILLSIRFPDKTCKHILIDCGMFQEEKYEALNEKFPFHETEIDHVIITHNHVDHTGRLPLLFKKGYRNSIHMSYPTARLLPLALYDSSKIIGNNAKLMRKRPIYCDADVAGVLSLVVEHKFEETFKLEPNIKVTFFKNGHLPGAVVGLLQISCPKYNDINILFTGDYSSHNMFFKVPPLPKWVRKLPLCVIQECTYGNMDSSDINFVFEGNIINALSKNKTILIPVFSLGRSQEIMYLLKTYQDMGTLDSHIPIFFDGPLGVRYTRLYKENALELDLTDFMPNNLKSVNKSSSRLFVKKDPSSKIVLSTSGMGSHGPALEYLKTFLGREDVLVHFSGYVAEGTLGRELHDCNNGEIIVVGGKGVRKLASVKYTSEFSAHAKADELLDFLKCLEKPNVVLINHGSVEAQNAYLEKVINEISPKDVGLLNGEFVFRINPYEVIKTLPTKYKLCN